MVKSIVIQINGLAYGSFNKPPTLVSRVGFKLGYAQQAWGNRLETDHQPTDAGMPMTMVIIVFHTYADIAHKIQLPHKLCDLASA